MNTRVCAVSFYTLKLLELQSCNRKTTIAQDTFRHCLVSFSSIVRQPFSKQLYWNLNTGGSVLSSTALLLEGLFFCVKRDGCCRVHYLVLRTVKRMYQSHSGLALNFCA